MTLLEKLITEGSFAPAEINARSDRLKALMSRYDNLHETLDEHEKDHGEFNDLDELHDTYYALIAKDGFMTLVGLRTNINELEKLDYLRESLIGLPREIVSQFSVKEGSYKLEWEALLATYDRKRLLLAQHVDALLATQKPKITDLKVSSQSTTPENILPDTMRQITNRTIKGDHRLPSKDGVKPTVEKISILGIVQHNEAINLIAINLRQLNTHC
ncbi:hypothetical protein M0802_013648 [Mischocyttarus mexicanus]|nr:hypothetical protein M0802_013648 [Mischocyttarus mexicanus]